MTFAVGDHVVKQGGEYSFRGVIVAAFRKLSGAERYVVENADGILHVFGPQNLRADVPPALTEKEKS